MTTISIRLALLLNLLFFCTTTFAHDIWTGTKTISSIQVNNDGGFMLTFDSEISEVCPHAGTNVLLISPFQNEVTITGAKSLLSTALIAFSTDSKVNIMYSNDTVYCWGKHLVISK